MKRRRKASARALGDAIDELVRDLGLAKIEEYDAIVRWGALVGAQVARVTEPLKIERGVLIVRVKNGPWRAELVMRKREILRKINAEIKARTLKDIRFI
jgi:predicted nucleic acid-binding Zn ribbon protein